MRACRRPLGCLQAVLSPLRAHSSPRHACALHRVLFLHYLHSGQEQAQQGCRGTERSCQSLRIPAPKGVSGVALSSQMDAKCAVTREGRKDGIR